MDEEINYTNAALYVRGRDTNCQAVIICTPLRKWDNGTSLHSLFSSGIGTWGAGYEKV